MFNSTSRSFVVFLLALCIGANVTPPYVSLLDTGIINYFAGCAFCCLLQSPPFARSESLTGDFDTRSVHCCPMLFFQGQVQQLLLNQIGINLVRRVGCHFDVTFGTYLVQGLDIEYHLKLYRCKHKISTAAIKFLYRAVFSYLANGISSICDAKLVRKCILASVLILNIFLQF